MKYSLSASFFNWRGASTTVTQRLQSSDWGQINLLNIQKVAEWAQVSTNTVYRFEVSDFSRRPHLTNIFILSGGKPTSLNPPMGNRGIFAFSKNIQCLFYSGVVMGEHQDTFRFHFELAFCPNSGMSATFCEMSPMPSQVQSIGPKQWQTFGCSFLR